MQGSPGAAACRRAEGRGRALKGERCEAGKAEEDCRMDEAGEVNGLEAAGGLGNVLGKGVELGERSGAGRSCPVPREGRARMPAGCLAGSDRQTAHTWMAASEAVCSRCPSWAELLAGGDGAMQRGVHTGVSLTRSLLVWGPDSGQEESQGGEGWTGAESDSRPGSWSVQPAAGAGGEGAKGREGALEEPLVEAGRGHCSARVPHSDGSYVLQN